MMNSLSALSLPFIICFLTTITAAVRHKEFLTGNISINCGSTEDFAAADGREWIGDGHEKIPSYVQIKGSPTSSSIAGESVVSADQARYKTARISRSSFSYTFRLSPGTKFIRLHFNPGSYRGFKGLKDLFTVEAGPFTLLGKFSASLTADALGRNGKFFAMEFCINIEEYQLFDIIFYPDQSINGAYAFINGIELIAMPTYLSYFHTGSIKGREKDGKHNILVAVESTDELADRNGPFKGFEILKVSHLDDSLANPSPRQLARDSPYGTMQRLLKVCGNRNVIATTAISIITIVAFKLWQLWDDNFMDEERERCRRFSLAEIEKATGNFNSEFVIGEGGFGRVYKGVIYNGKETVAIKRLKPSSRQGAHEFSTEIKALSEFRHVNIVSLIGYCDEEEEMILVYEYMARGKLGNHINLYKHDMGNNPHSSLSWNQCLNICIGAARGLDYLHTECKIIHRDVKTSNILLNENNVAKFSDFGLAKLENICQSQSHVSTVGKGTPGYMDPYYIKFGKLTSASDVYSFGVVLLAVLCGRPALDPRLKEDGHSLVKWARRNISKGYTKKIVSSNLMEEILPDSLNTFVRTAESCIDEEPKNRPSMTQVVSQLESALELQENPYSLKSEKTSTAIGSEPSSEKDRKE